MRNDTDGTVKPEGMTNEDTGRTKYFRKKPPPKNTKTKTTMVEQVSEDISGIISGVQG